MREKILQYVRPYRRQWALYLCLAVLASMLQLPAPWPMKIVVDMFSMQTTYALGVSLLTTTAARSCSASASFRSYRAA